ncbi:MAG: RnfH family protein [Pseudohongiellaceae bacterium]
MAAECIKVEVAYALPDRQLIVELRVEKGATALDAAMLSGIDREFPELDLQRAEMGVFSKMLDGLILPSPDQYVLQEKDRVEIYRPLLLDPKQARLLRAARQTGKSRK